MLPEYILSVMTAALLGWGGFTWRRAETAILQARAASDKSDKLELKVAENYITKQEFELSMNRLFKTLNRFEEKLDHHLYDQGESIKAISKRLKDDEEQW